MCGIAGVLDRRRRDAELRDVGSRMAACLQHRGPDDGGVWVEEGVVLAHRRLAVIDLSADGHQPMVSHDGRLVLVYNGEIYNFPSLRRRLEGEGASFRGGSDTEVLLAAIERWGLDATLAELNGMFAFAVWDRHSEVLSLARDRFGEKPLFVAAEAGRVVFGSELHALRLGGHHSTVDRDALRDLLALGYIRAPRSILQRVAKVLPGEVVEFAGDGRQLRRRRYWVPPVDPWRDDLDSASLLDELDCLVTDAVRLRMVADVPVGAFLSGGIDSSLVVATMQKVASGPVRTFTIGFDEEKYNEAVHAKEVAKVLGTEHHELYVTPADALAVIPRLPDMYDEPFADMSQIPTFLVSELARRTVTVALSGDGGDELFGGYERYSRALEVSARLGRVPPQLRHVAARSLAAAGPGVGGRLLRVGYRALGREAPPDAGHKAMRLASLLARQGERAQYEDLLLHWHDADAVVLGAGAWEPYGADVAAPYDHLDWMMRADIAVYLPDDILVKVDRASMAVSLESRIPLLDPAIVEFALRLPSDVRIGATGGKTLLRDLLARSIPRELFERPKMGFGVPMGEWLRGPLKHWAGDLLSTTRLRSEDYFDAAAVARLWEQHQRGERNHEYALYDVLVFQAWLDRWEQN